MMKDVDIISRCVEPFVHQYNMTDVRRHSENFNQRSFAYSFDVFTRCTNQRHITASNVLAISITTASITSISALYHSPIKLSLVFSIIIHPSILSPDHSSCVSPFPIISPSHITWMYFDSVINSFVSILSTQGYNTIQHFICASNPLHFSIATTLSPYAFIFYISFQQCFTSLHHQLSLAVNHVPNRYIPNSLLTNDLPNRNRDLPNSSYLDLPKNVLLHRNRNIPTNSCSFLLPRKNSNSFPLTSIHRVTGIDFT